MLVDDHARRPADGDRSLPLDEAVARLARARRSLLLVDVFDPDGQ
jgi:hypothetical protein